MTGYTIQGVWEKEGSGWVYTATAYAPPPKPNADPRVVVVNTLQTFSNVPPDEELPQIQKVMEHVKSTCSMMADLVP